MEKLQIQLMTLLAKMLTKEQAIQICTVIILKKQEQVMINYLMEKTRTEDEIVRKMIGLIK